MQSHVSHSLSPVELQSTPSRLRLDEKGSCGHRWGSRGQEPRAASHIGVACQSASPWHRAQRAVSAETCE
eukprot:258377-Pleurochrysis_carterae.AAC.1